LIEVQQFQVEEICRWFGVPPHKVQHLLRATFTNIESQGIEVVVDSIAPWVKRFEDEADFKLFGQNRTNFYTKIDMRGLMRGDAAARAAYYKTMRESGAYSVNRILELEDENTIGPLGDMHVINSTYRTLEWVEDQLANPAAVGAADEPEPDDGEVTPAPDAPGEDEAAQASVDELIRMLSPEPAHV